MARNEAPSKKARRAATPNLVDKLGDAFLKAFEADFQIHGVNVIEQLREKSPEKYAEIATKLIAAAEQPISTSPYADTKSVRDVGRVLLQQVGMAEWNITDDLADQAVAANDRFVNEVQVIAAQADN